MAHRILVTGVTGFIGSHLSAELVREGYPVVGLSLRGRTKNITSLLDRKNFHLAMGDIREPHYLRTLIKDQRISTVFHLAAKLPNSQDNLNSQEYFDINIKGTLNLLEAADSGGVEKVIYSSSMAAYATPAKRLPVAENDALQPSTIYAISKAAGESCCHLFSKRMDVTVLRFGGGYGPRERNSNAMYKFILQALQDSPVTVWGDGLQSTDFVYVDDIVKACVSAFSRNKPGIYNIASGEETSIMELAKRIVHLTNSKSEIILSGRGTDRPFRFVLDVTKAQKELNLVPMLLEAGLPAYLKQFHRSPNK